MTEERLEEAPRKCGDNGLLALLLDGVCHFTRGSIGWDREGILTDVRHDFSHYEAGLYIRHTNIMTRKLDSR